MAWREIPADTIGKGTYRLTLGNYAGTIPQINVPKSFELFGNRFSLLDYFHSSTTGTLTVVVRWEQFDTVQQIVPSATAAPATTVTVRTNVNKNTQNANVVAIPAAAIVLAVAAVFGVVAYFNLQKVEELVESPSVSIFVVAVAVVAIVLVFKSLRS